MSRAPWLNGILGIDLGEAIAKSAIDDVGIHETPMGSNRGKEIDEYNLLAESPTGSYWCGNFVGYHYRKSEAQIPRFTGRCQAWLEWSKSNATFICNPEIGAAIFYAGKDGITAEHMGVVVCLDPLFTIEGNTTLDGYSKNGDVVTLKYPTGKNRKILGYARPIPR